MKLSLWGVPNRAAAWAFVWLSVLLAVACVVYGFWDSRYFVGILFLLAALGYWLALRWVDHNGSW